MRHMGCFGSNIERAHAREIEIKSIPTAINPADSPEGSCA